MIEYPEMAQTMERATDVQDIGHKKEIVDMAKGLLTPGADPKEVIAQYDLLMRPKVKKDAVIPKHDSAEEGELALIHKYRNLDYLNFFES